MRSLASIVGVLALAGLLAGCTSAGVAVTDSTRPVRAGEYEPLGKTAGSSWAGYMYILNFIPIHFGEHDCAGAARDDALEKAPGSDALVDVVADRMIVVLPIPIVHVILTITDVEGQAIKTKPVERQTPGTGGGR